jgi:hypothetical protein
MSKRYPGGIIRKTPQTPSQTSAQGIWDMASVTQAVKENTWPIAGVPDPISKSLRFRASASAYLSNTSVSPTLGTKSTYSIWVKRGALGGTMMALLDADQNGAGASYDELGFESNNTLYFYSQGASAVLNTSAVYRDSSAWYHIVLAIDTTQSTAANRVLLYVNGIQVTAFSSASYPAQNYVPQFQVSGRPRYIGQRYNGSPYFDGYLTEIYFIDGQQLTPSSFGNTNDQTGVWQPIAYTGTYGTNGFYLPFSNTASTTTLGYDFSGNSNNWTTNNISLTSGSTYDSMADVPTQWIPYNTAGDTGALFRGNYAVMNPLRPFGGSLSNGNLTAVTGNTGSANSGVVTSTVWLPTSGKFYFEATPTTVGEIAIGLTTNSNISAALYYRGGDIYINGSVATTQASYTNNDVIGVAVDIGGATVQFYKNNAAQGTAQSISAITAPLVACLAQLSGGGSATANINFGQQPFSYTPPSGFKTLNTTNLPTPTIGATASTTANKYFDVSLYTGNGSSVSVTNSGSMQPDLVWGKSRSNAINNSLVDSVRGVSKSLFSNLTDAEDSAAGYYITAFNSNGFTVGLGTTLNTNGATYVGWQWRASNTTAVTNTAGTISSQVSANTTAGFSIATFTAPSGSTAYTVGHGLGTTPAMIIVKERGAAGNDWYVWHQSYSNTAQGNQRLNTTAAVGNSSQIWNNTAPTSTVFSSISGTAVSSSTTAVAYCFAQVAGYSAFGSYTGNGSTDGTFVYLGFRPRWVLIKHTNQAGNNWRLVDTSRLGYNADNYPLFPSLADGEAATVVCDMLSNGIKFRSTAQGVNGSGDTYIYAAFAESPFKYSLAR